MKVGFVGLGVMGFPMARHLAGAGHDLAVFNRSPEKAIRFVQAHGGVACESPGEAAHGRDFLVMCVGNDDDVRGVVAETIDQLAPGGVIVDHTTTGGVPDVDWGRPVDIPQRVLDDLLGQSDTRIAHIEVRNGVVVAAPGSLDLGRTTRLANRAQRRALRALYRGCGIPGCDVSFDRCTIHHVVWWRHGGRTDLENLLPLCPHHHTLVHTAGWVITLGPNRELTLRLPDGSLHNTGPPSRKAA